jgi:hypothetical protein
MSYDICIYQKRKRKTNLYISIFKWGTTRQYMVLESLYLQVTLVNIFICIDMYIHILIYIYPYRWLKVEVHNTYDI